MAQTHYDAIIIGAGIIGAAVGLELARKGYRTINVDRLPAAGYGSTSNSCAIIRTYYSTLEGCAMAFEGYHYWRDWADYIGVDDPAGLAGFVECGTLVIKTDHNRHLAPVMKMSDQLGIAYEQWDARTIAQRMPAWDLARFSPVRAIDDPRFGEPSGTCVAGAVFWPQGGYVTDPQLATHNLQCAAQAAGGEFHFNARITGISGADKGRVTGVELEDGSLLHAPIVVNVAGPHSAVVNQMAGIAGRMNIGTRALRHEVPHVLAPPDYDHERYAMVTSDSDIGAYTRPASGGRILIGSEDPACDTRQFVDPDDFDTHLGDQGRVQVMRCAQRLPSLGIPNRVTGVVDLYDVSDDWIPIYDKSDLEGFYLAIGTSGNQFKNAPVAGKLMAALIDACENGRDHDANPMPFHLDHVDRDIDIGFYSRNREINRDSSFSVLG